MAEIGSNAKKAAIQIASASSETKNQALLCMSEHLRRSQNKILSENRAFEFDHAYSG